MEDEQKYKTFTIKGKEYIKTKLVKLDKRIFQEYSCIDIESPCIAYVDEQTLLLVEDWETYAALREKYARDKEFLRTGNLILKTGFSEQEEQIFLEKLYTEMQNHPELAGKPLIRDDSWSPIIYYRVITDEGTELALGEFNNEEKGGFVFSYRLLDLINEKIYRKETKEIQKLFPHDVAELSEIVAEKFAHIFKKHGIENPQKWVKDKLRMYGDVPYHINHSIDANGVRHPDGKIVFNSLEKAQSDKNLRTHENVHNITGKKHGNCGLVVVKEEVHQDKTVWNASGIALNEGGTNYITEIVTGKETDSYEAETFTAKEVAKIVGKDIFIEAMLFQSPKLLADKFNEKVGKKSAYHELTTTLDEYNRLEGVLNVLYATSGNTTKEYVEVWNARNKKLCELHKCLCDATLNQVKNSKGFVESVKAEINFWQYIGSNLSKLPAFGLKEVPKHLEIYGDNVKRIIKERLASISMFNNDKNNDKTLEQI